MSYYMGDFYRGDPGIGSFFKKALGFAAGFIPGVGPIASKVIGILPGGGRPAVAGAITGAASRMSQAIVKHPVLSAAGAAGALGVAAGAGSMAMMGGGGSARSSGVRGFHPCKSKHGCKTGAMVRNRHMNVCNPRALRRAIRRARGFTKLAMHTIHLVHPKKKGRFGGFKARKRK